ncbi:hypothetical protein ACLESD_24650 [Pyxidicoccus sp. 3LFB2]
MRELLRLAFKEYRWFEPAQDVFLGEDPNLKPGSTDFSAHLAYYDEAQHLSISDSREKDFLILSTSKRTEFPFVGSVSWSVSVDEQELAGWCSAHLQQVLELMRLVGASLAEAGTFEDTRRKEERFIPNPDGFGTEQTFTVRDPSEGLAGLYWRNFFGPPFVRMFGERLLSLPPSACQELGNGLVLVQPYELPTLAMTPEGDAAEERLITVLGPECFYDHRQHRKPTRVPELTLLTS